jgi:hypothetical protein
MDDNETVSIYLKELRDDYGFIIEACNAIIKHTALRELNLRLISKWVQIIDSQILKRYSGQNLPKAVTKSLVEANNRLEQLGFVDTFKRFENWPY